MNHSLRVVLLNTGGLVYMVFSALGSFSQNLSSSVENFSPDSYQSESYTANVQNWDIIQGKDGLIYVANYGTPLVYDGSEWSAVKGAGRLSSRYLERTSNGKIFVGSFKDVGYLGADSIGAHTYFSLKEQLPDTLSDDLSIKGMYSWHDSVFFLNSQELLIWKDREGTFDILPTPPDLNQVHMLNNTMYIWCQGQGLFSYQQENWVPVISVAGKQKWEVEQLIPQVKEGNLSWLIFTRSNGIFKSQGESLSPYSSQLNRFYPNLAIYDAIRLRDGKIAIATHDEGVLILDSKGQIFCKIDKSSGLQINTVISLYQDTEGGIWTALDYGISRLNYPFTVQGWGPARGIEGTVFGILRKEPYLIVCTTTGVYLAREEARSPLNFAFDKLPEIREAWDIVDFQDKVLIAASDGVYELELPTKLTRITPDKQFRGLEVSRIHPGFIFLGTTSGIGFLQRVGNSWRYLSEEIELGHRVRNMVETSVGALWGSWESGVSRVDFGGNFPREYETLSLSEDQGKPINMQSIEVFSFEDRVLFGTDLGFYEFDTENQVFGLNEDLYPDGMDDSTSSFAPYVDGAGRIWFSTTGKLNGYIDPANENAKRFYHKAYMPMDDYAWCFYSDPQGHIWVGTATGLYRTTFSAPDPGSTHFSTLIRTVKVNEDSLIFGGLPPGDLTVSQVDNGDNNWRFPPDITEVNFSFAAVQFSYSSELSYSYMLEGYDKNWSDWRKVNAKSYTGLWEGTYTFRVKARNFFGQESETASFSFVVLPPWYRTTWAYLLYTLLSVAFMIGLVTYFTRKHKQRLAAKELELTKEKETAERLRMVDRLKNEFLANTSHELRTPLNGIIGITEALREGVAGKVNLEMKESLSLVVSSGKRLASLVDDILDLSKIRNRDLQLTPKAVDLFTAVDVNLKLNTPLTKGKQLQLENKVPQDLPPVWADENRLQQILQNLIGNGIKFTGEGVVSVSAQIGDTPGFAELKVQDTGIGIPTDKQELIFKEFEQVDGSTQREYGGIGLGLSITRQLVELHGGTIWVDSEPGMGSSFYVRLPLAPEGYANPVEKGVSQTYELEEAPLEIAVVPIPDQKTKVASREDQIRILVVDDEPINQQVLKNHLTGHRFEIVPAMNGPEALELLERQPFDLILLDIMMPKMSGYEVCQRIREKYLPSELPVIMVTAKNQVNDLVHGLEVGANDYLAKPFSRSEFLARVRTHLNLHTINSATAKFIPTEFIRSLGYQTITEVRLGDHVEKEVTVMFADIRDYTSLSEVMTPAENFRFVNAFTRRMGPMIQQSGGFVNQYLGDCIMSIYPHKVEDALNAAINMQKTLIAYNEERALKNRVPIQVGIGMHTGQLILGIIGDNKHLEATSIADSVNTSARMESLTKYYGASIILSEKSLERITFPIQYNYRYLGPVQVKGKKAVLDIYEFFDGDPEDQVLAKFDTKSVFEEGMKLYLNREFTSAVKQFAAVLQVNPSDGPATYFLRKAQEHASQGVPEHWTGVETMQQK